MPRIRLDIQIEIKNVSPEEADEIIRTLHAMGYPAKISKRDVRNTITREIEES